MHVWTFLKAGIEVLHLGMQSTEGNAWPPSHWKENKGRWRIYTPAVDAYLNHNLTQRGFGTSVERFVFILEIADFASWGGPPAFTNNDGYVSYRFKKRELVSVAKLDWLDIQFLTPAQQLEALRAALVCAVKRVATQKRKPKNFQVGEFANELSVLLEHAKASQLGRVAYLREKEA